MADLLVNGLFDALLLIKDGVNELLDRNGLEDKVALCETHQTAVNRMNRSEFARKDVFHRGRIRPVESIFFLHHRSWKADDDRSAGFNDPVEILSCECRSVHNLDPFVASFPPWLWLWLLLVFALCLGSRFLLRR